MGATPRQFATVVRAFEDVRRTLPKEHRPPTAPTVATTPYDSWLRPVRLLTSWPDEGTPACPGHGSADAVTTTVAQAGPCDFTSVLEQEMAKMRTLTSA